MDDKITITKDTARLCYELIKAELQKNNATKLYSKVAEHKLKLAFKELDSQNLVGEIKNILRRLNQNER